MSQQPIPLHYLLPPDPNEIPSFPKPRRSSEDDEGYQLPSRSAQVPASIPTETRAAMMTYIDDYPVEGWKQGTLLREWAREHGYDPAECAAVVRLTRENTRQATEAHRLESMAASAAADVSAYPPYPQARTPVRPTPTSDNSRYHSAATQLNSLVQKALGPDFVDLTDVWHDILQGVTRMDRVTQLLEGIKRNDRRLYDTILTVLAENPPPSTDTVPEYTRPAPGVNPIPLLVTPNSSGRTTPTTDESMSTDRSPPPPHLTDAYHPAVLNVRQPTRELRSPRPSRYSSPAPSRSASPSNELVLVRNKRRGSNSAMVMSRPSSPFQRPATPSALSRYVSWGPSTDPATVEPATVVRSRTTIFNPEDVSATIIETKRTEGPPVPSSQTDRRRTQSTGDHRSGASKPKDHTHLTQSITSTGKKRTEFFF